MGISFGVEQQDGTKQLRDDISGWAFLETGASLAWTLAWLNAAMPRVLRGGSVFAPYLIPPARHVKYMNGRNEAAATETDTDDPAPPGGR